MTTYMQLDVESGTYFGAPPIRINADKWTEERSIELGWQVMEILIQMNEEVEE